MVSGAIGRRIYLSANRKTRCGNELPLVFVPERTYPRRSRAAILHRMSGGGDRRSRSEVLEADAGTRQAARTFSFEPPRRHLAVLACHIHQQPRMRIRFL